jgi:hypothetical protein
MKRYKEEIKVSKYRMMMNLEKIECKTCEGIFSTGEIVVKVDDSSYCEACYDDLLEGES